jgi:hypothetical protein
MSMSIEEEVVGDHVVDDVVVVLLRNEGVVFDWVVAVVEMVVVVVDEGRFLL